MEDPNNNPDLEDTEETEEVEVLPYDSVFDWTIKDPMGFYRENERYNHIKKEYGVDKTKALIIEDMWKDRTKYHNLRRFAWPPKMIKGIGFFYSRGFYEDYESRPTIDVNKVTDKPSKENKRKNKKSYKKARLELYNQVLQDDIKKGIERKEVIIEETLNTGQQKEKGVKNKDGPMDWEEYTDADYDKTLLEVDKIAEGTTEFTLQNIFPNATVKMGKPDKDGLLTAVLSYKDANSAGIDFMNSRNADISGTPLNVAPKARYDASKEPKDPTANKSLKKVKIEVVSEISESEASTIDVVETPKMKGKSIKPKGKTVTVEESEASSVDVVEKPKKGGKSIKPKGKNLEVADDLASTATEASTVDVVEALKMKGKSIKPKGKNLEVADDIASTATEASTVDVVEAPKMKGKSIKPKGKNLEVADDIASTTTEASTVDVVETPTMKGKSIKPKSKPAAVEESASEAPSEDVVEKSKMKGKSIKPKKNAEFADDIAPSEASTVEEAPKMKGKSIKPKKTPDPE